MTGSRMNEAYDKAKKCLDQLLSNDQIPFYGYVEIMLQLDVIKKAMNKGEWNEIQAGMFVCPFCGATPHKQYKNFCPKCGARMERSDEE